MKSAGTVKLLARKRAACGAILSSGMNFQVIRVYLVVKCRRQHAGRTGETNHQEVNSPCPPKRRKTRTKPKRKKKRRRRQKSKPLSPSTRSRWLEGSSNIPSPPAR